MNYADYMDANGFKRELTPHPPRNCWKKYIGGKTKYFDHPLTKAGYAAALEEFVLLKAKMAGERPHAQVYHHHTQLFGQVIKYYEAFGVAHDERDLHREVQQFIKFIDDELAKPHLDGIIPILWFTRRHPAFEAEFLERPYSALGSSVYDLPAKWHDRIARMAPKRQEKTPQTIEYWVEAYLASVKARVGRNVRQKSAANRGHKIAPFKSYADLQAHISIIDDDFVEAYHRHVDDLSLAKSSKVGYFSTFRMFVSWCGRNKRCDLVTPANLDSTEFGFREPMGTGRKRMAMKEKLWTKEHIDLAKKLPEPYNCFCLLMLNCGFRHVDISQLQHTDIHWTEKRIVIQREKLNQQEKAPVISYPLWDCTIKAIRATMTDPATDDLVFRNRSGGQVESSIKTWWHRHASEHGLGGRTLDMLRKTGSTIIERYDRMLDEMYLGETLSAVAKIHYSFNDGEPCPALDKGIAHLGSQFGLCKEPTKTVELSPEAIETLRKFQKTGKLTKKAMSALNELQL